MRRVPIGMAMLRIGMGLFPTSGCGAPLRMGGSPERMGGGPLSTGAVPLGMGAAPLGMGEAAIRRGAAAIAAGALPIPVRDAPLRIEMAPIGLGTAVAKIRMSPLLTMRVRDSYLYGTGSMLASVAGMIPIVNAWGRTDLASGALHRYLAEAVWLPTALLPGGGVIWEPLDDNTARATLTDSGVSVSLDFRFNDKGEVVSVYTPARFREVNGKGLPTPWAGLFRKYGRVDGVMVPREGEVAWILPEGRLTYWRGRIERRSTMAEAGAGLDVVDSLNSRTSGSDDSQAGKQT